MAAWRYEISPLVFKNMFLVPSLFLNIRREIPWSELTKEFIICGQCQRWSHKTW